MEQLLRELQQQVEQVTAKEREKLQRLLDDIHRLTRIIALEGGTAKEVDKKMNELEVWAYAEYKKLNDDNHDAMLMLLLALFPLAFVGQLNLMQPTLQPPNLEQQALDNQRWTQKTYSQRAYDNNLRLFVRAWDKVKERVRRNRKSASERTYNALLKELDELSHTLRYRSHFLIDEEAHRTVEKARYEAAVFVGGDVRKTWVTMDDNRVRNDVFFASHVALEGASAPLLSPFDLVPNGRTQYPSASGIAEQDINCRCHLRYE